jgi:hypothetical protein
MAHTHFDVPLDQFKEWPKIPRLRGPMVVTEKVDGNPAQVTIRLLGKGDTWMLRTDLDTVVTIDNADSFAVRAGARRRWVAPGREDVFGFAQWTRGHARQLVEQLGVGRHYGEWYGAGIQRTYGLDHRRWALFNTKRWMTNRSVLADPIIALQREGVAVDVVPILYAGQWSSQAVEECLEDLRVHGSLLAASSGWSAEGVVVYHATSHHLYKVHLSHEPVPQVPVDAAGPF